jgi:Chitobiase/beta-hexosaminidase C-terminal domain
MERSPPLKTKMKKLLPFFLFLISLNVRAATWFVDSTATGSNNGTSWANAWTSLNSASAIAAGDTVFISGGPTGGTRTYNVSGNTFPIKPGTSPTVRTTYRIGQDALHNGTATINGTVSTGNYFVIDGNAGDGARHFNMPIPWMSFSTSNATYVKFSYINYGNSSDAIRLERPVHIEVDHCYLRKTVGNPDWATAIGGFEQDDATGFGNNAIHHNEFYIPRNGKGDGGGDDGWTSFGSGTDFYNNLVVGYFDPTWLPPQNQHQDGIQMSGNANWVRIYNNIFVDCSNSAIYTTTFNGPSSHWRIYNNIMAGQNQSITGSPMRGIDINEDGGHPDYQDYVVCNNILVNLGDASRQASFGIRLDGLTNYINCIATNNITIWAAGFDFKAGVTNSNNFGDFQWNTDVNNNFVNYVAFGGLANDLHLKSGSQFRNAGTNMTSYGITTDFDGNPRPATGAWDAGPYQFGAVAGPPTLSTATINSAGNKLILLFDKSVQAGSGGSAGWSLGVTPSASLGAVTGIGTNTLTYDITGRVINSGESVTLNYTQPGNGIEETTAGADLASISGRAVTNNSTAGLTATPVITLAAGPYFGTQSTTITDSDSASGAVIHYTVDGSTPTGSSPTYSAPISIATNQTIKAIATWSGHVNSGVASSAYEVISWTTAGTAFKTFSVPQQTGTFTWNVSATAPAAGSDVTFGLGPAAVSAFSQMAVLVEFNNNTINAFNGGSGLYTAGPAYTPGALYNFVASVNMTAHTWSVTVTPAAGGATSTIVSGVAFRSGHASDSQLSWVGMAASSGSLSLSAMSFPSGAASARYIGIRGVPAAGGATP